MLAGQERRRQIRLPAEYTYFAHSGERRFHGVSHDVSPYGISILTKDEVALGDKLDLRVFVPTLNIDMGIKGEVRHCTQLPGSLAYLVGVMITEGTLEHLSKPEMKGKTSRHTPTQTLIIKADAKLCYEFLADYKRYPEWASGIVEARVLDHYTDGRGRRVEFMHDFFFRKVRYALDYTYNDEKNILSWVSAGGDEEIMKITGSYAFVSSDKVKTFATYTLDITLSIVPAERLVQYVTTFLMRKEMKNFKNFVEKNAGGTFH